MTQIVSPESSWENNHFCVTYLQNWANSQSFQIFLSKWPIVHSMAIGNLNKSKETKPTTTTALKVAPKRAIIHKNFIPPLFGPYFIKFSKTVSYEVNLAAQSSHLEVDNGPLECYL